MHLKNNTVDCNNCNVITIIKKKVLFENLLNCDSTVIQRTLPMILPTSWRKNKQQQQTKTLNLSLQENQGKHALALHFQ